MPPAAIAFRVVSTGPGSPTVSISSSAEAGGNLGAEPKPPCSMSAATRRALTAPSTTPRVS